MADCPDDIERLGPRPFFAATSRSSRRGGEQARSASRCGSARRLAVRTITALSFVIPAAACATSPAIYKCLDNRLGLVYTDVPCKDGEKLDIRAGDADPAAVARLERMRDQLDQSAAQRIGEERRAATARMLANTRREAEEEMNASQYAMAYAPFDYGYIAYPLDMRRRAPHLHSHKLAQPRRFAPSPPYIVPKPVPR